MATSSMSLKRISTLYLVLIVTSWLVVLSFFASRNEILADNSSLQSNIRTQNVVKEPKAIVVGLPKSGTTSVYHYFSCNGFDTTHYCCCGSNETQYPCANGRQMSNQLFDNLRAGRSLLSGIVGNVHAQLDGELFDNPKEPYFLPQHFHLKELHAAAPHATWILPIRSADGWKRSVLKWLDMGERLQKAYDSHAPNSHWNDFLVEFYDLHTETVRQACKRYQRKCVEVQVDDNAGALMEQAFPGTRATCWGRHNAGPFFQVVESP
jgi:hypothetical protein